MSCPCGLAAGYNAFTDMMAKLGGISCMAYGRLLLQQMHNTCQKVVKFLLITLVIFFLQVLKININFFAMLKQFNIFQIITFTYSIVRFSINHLSCLNVIHTHYINYTNLYINHTCTLYKIYTKKDTKGKNKI